jgi:hypothetical protein
VLSLSLLYRDVDRLPYLHALRRCAAAGGLQVDLVRHRQTGNEDWGEVLRRGEIDAIAENYWALQRYRAAGVRFVTVASAAHRWMELLLVRSGIDALRDLRGRKVAVRMTGPQASFPKVLLGRLGLLDAVELIVYSEKETGRWGHWKPVADSACDACFILPAYSDAPLAAGLSPIPYPDFGFDGAHIIPTTTESFVARNRDVIRGLVRAMFEAGERIAADPGWLLEIVRADCVEALREHFLLADDAEIARFTERQRSEIAPLPIPTVEGLRNALEVAREQYETLEGFNPLVMWDLSFAREMLAANPSGALRT